MAVTSIPIEIVDLILSNEKLSIADVMSFSLTCKQIYEDVTTSNMLWKKKTLQRWEFISKVIGNEETASPVDWFVETKGQSFRHTQLKKYLADIAANDRTKMPISYSDMTHLDALLLPDITARSKNYYLWIEESNAILRDDDEANLSDEYYGRIVQSYVTRTYVTLEWERFLSLPEKNQTLERVDILLCQSIEPSTPIYPKDISDSLDNIARLVRESIAKDHPDLSINNKKFAEEASSWKNEILYDNKWSPRESMIIILSLCETMFGRMGFDGNVRTFGPPPTIDESLPYQVYRNISTVTIFDGVSRRLGLRFEIINDDIIDLLRWKERYTVEGDETAAIYFVDIVGAGSDLRTTVAPCKELPEYPPAATVSEVVEDMASNILFYHSYDNYRFSKRRWSTEFLHMIRPRNVRYLVELIELYMYHRLDFGRLVDSLREFPDSNDYIEFFEGRYRRWQSIREIHSSEGPKIRTAQLRYVVGMIVTDRSNTMSVVTGWDVTKYDNPDGLIRPYCRDIDNLKYGEEQPYYSIYRTGDTSFYVPEETLTLARSPEAVSHLDIGRYFTLFKGHYYLPNIGTARMYPEDSRILSELYDN